MGQFLGKIGGNRGRARGMGHGIRPRCGRLSHVLPSTDMNDRLETVLASRFDQGAQGGQVDRGQAEVAIDLVVVHDLDDIGRRRGQVGDLVPGFIRGVDDSGGSAELGAMSVRRGEAWAGREEHGALRTLVPLSVAELQDHLLGAEQIEDEGDAIVERRAGGSFGSEQLRCSTRRSVAPGVYVQVCQSRDDKAAFNVENPARKLRWNVSHDVAYSASFDEENAASHRLVSGVQDDRIRKS